MYERSKRNTSVQISMIKRILPCFPVVPVLMLFVAFTADLVFTSPSNSSSRNIMRFESLDGFELVGHVIETLTTDELGCGLRCLRNEKCLSYNKHTNGTCQLSNHTRHSSQDRLRHSTGSTYHGKDFLGSSSSRPGHSCKYIRDSGDSKGDGEYWIDPKKNGNPLKVYCDMTNNGDLLGWYSYHPGHSCKHIRDTGDSKGDGEYWIDPEKNGNLLTVYCDMTTDSGGWLLVSNVVIDSSTPPFQFSVESSYRAIGSCHTKKMFLAKSAMNELRTHLSFTQLRFYCSKQQGRTFHVTTVANSTGEAVVQYFSGQTDVQPDACGSFVKMDNDNSLSTGFCHRWGKEGNTYQVGKWGHGQNEDRLFNHPAFVQSLYHWMMKPAGNRLDCDDVSVGGQFGNAWKVFVR